MVKHLKKWIVKEQRISYAGQYEGRPDSVSYLICDPEYRGVGRIGNEKFVIDEDYGVKYIYDKKEDAEKFLSPGQTIEKDINPLIVS